MCSAVSGIYRTLEKLVETALRGSHEKTLEVIRDRHFALAEELGVDGRVLLNEFLQQLLPDLVEELLTCQSLARPVIAPVVDRIQKQA